jgi:hypothetical protein
MREIKDSNIIYFKSGSSDNIELIICRENNKMKIYEPNNNLLISIKKNIKENSQEYDDILYFLGYYYDNYKKDIFICSYYKKSCFKNKKIYDAIFIISSSHGVNDNNGSIVLYKYKIINKYSYKYDSTFIQKEQEI